MYITELQAKEIARLGITVGLGNYPFRVYSLDDVKQICPYTLSTGQDEKGSFATTRIQEPETYVYADTEAEAAADLLIQQLTNRDYTPTDCNWKTAARQQSKVSSLKK